MERAEWNKEKSGVNIESGTLLMHLSAGAKYKRMEKQSCREVIQKQRWEFHAAPLLCF